MLSKCENLGSHPEHPHKKGAMVKGMPVTFEGGDEGHWSQWASSLALGPTSDLDSQRKKMDRSRAEHLPSSSGLTVQTHKHSHYMLAWVLKIQRWDETS